MAVSAQEAAKRLREAGVRNSDRYEMGTSGKGSKWEAAKTRAKANFSVGMSEALSEQRYEKGLDNSSASDYDQGVRGKGKQNWSTGMQAAESKYTKNIAPFVPLWGQDLPTAGGPRRSAANISRMTENVQRFINAKKS